MNLKNPPRVFTETAILQNKGNVSLVREELKTFLDQVPELIPEFASVQSQVIAALESYGVWLEKELLPKSTGNFRIGENKFAVKMRYTLHCELPIHDVVSRDRPSRDKESHQGGSRSVGRIASDQRIHRSTAESGPGGGYGICSAARIGDGTARARKDHRDARVSAWSGRCVLRFARAAGKERRDFLFDFTDA